MTNVFRNITRILAFSLFTTLYAHTCELCTYEVTPENIKSYETGGKLKDTTEAFKILDKYINWYFNSRDDMALQLSQELKDYPHFLKTVNNFVLESWMVREKKIKEEVWLDSIVDKVWLTAVGMDSLKKYMVLGIRGDQFSTTILKFLNELQGVRFADSLLARRYALSLLAASLAICSDTSKAFAIFDTVHWNDEEIQNLMKLVDNVKLPQLSKPQTTTKKKKSNKKNTEQKESQSELLTRFFSRYRGRSCSDERWNLVFTRLDSLYSHLFENVVSMAMYQDETFDDSKPIEWGGADCGCSRKDQLNGDVIGIYPYWFAGDTTKWVDFSAITRISFYGIYANIDGVLQMPSGIPTLTYLGKKGFSKFVSEAHRHYVKMDWIIEKSDWRGIKNHESLGKFFAKLTKEIDSLVSAPNNTLFQKMVNKLSFSGDDYGNRGDGVTLYFKNYPTDSLSTAMFNRFFKDLHQLLLSRNPNAYLNMMVNRLDLTEDIYAHHIDSDAVKGPEGIYSYANFRKIITEPKTEKGVSPSSDQIVDKLKNLLLVINEEPLSRSNRLIHSDLSLQLKGEDRHIVLKALAPVIWFDNRQWDQLSDDATYYNDSYYSLGIAPYATDIDAAEICGNKGNIGVCLNEYFKKDDKDITFSSQIRSEFPFFCMYRWAFRLLNTLVYIVALALLLGYFSSCTPSAFFDKHLALLVGLVVIPPAFTTTILVLFDPVATSLAGAFRFLPIIVLVLSVITASLIKVYRNADFPKRKIK